MLPFVFVLAVLHVANANLRFLVIGDWGVDPSDSQYADQVRVARMMDNICAQNGCDFIITTGDNFYANGVTSVTDPRWEVSWRDIYFAPELTQLHNLTWYASIGNHDAHVDDREWHQVDYHYQVNRQWYLPNLTYTFQMDAGGRMVDFVALDCESQITGKIVNDPDGQSSWVESVLQNSPSSNWKVTYGHQPPYSGGTRTGDAMIRAVYTAMIDQHNVDLALWGHEHNMQHIRPMATSSKTVDNVVCGGGGKGLYGRNEAGDIVMEADELELAMFQIRHGICWVNIAANQLDTIMYAPVPGNNDGSFEILTQFSKPFPRQ